MVRIKLIIANAYFNLINRVNAIDKKYFYQVCIQLFSNTVVLILSFLISILATKNILPQEYGEYRYVVTYLLLIPGLINFGYTNSVGRLIAINPENEHSKISGYGLTISTVLSISSVLLLMPIITILKINGALDISWYLIFLTPFIVLTTMQLFVQSILTGQNRIHSLAMFNLLPQFLIFIFIVVQIYIFKYATALTLLIPYVVINGIAIIYRTLQCRPSKVGLFESFLALKDENRHFGFKVYIGSIFGVTIGHVLSLISGNYVGMEEYGYFALAFSFVIPFQMLAASFGIVLYRSNVLRIKISLSLFACVISISLIAYLFFYIIISNFFVTIFSSDYIKALPYIKILALYGIFIGIGDFINRFLGAKGYGQKIMMGAVFTGLTIIIASSVFVPKYQIDGLIFSYLLSGFVYLSYMSKQYINYRKLYKISF